MKVFNNKIQAKGSKEKGAREVPSTRDVARRILEPR